jgi:hypothetical protein
LIRLIRLKTKQLPDQCVQNHFALAIKAKIEAKDTLWCDWIASTPAKPDERR